VTERELRSTNEDDYWSHDLLLGEARIGRETSLVRLKLHASEEPYRRRAAADIVSLAHPAGVATYVHARPYVLEPVITLTIGVFPAPTDQGVIGEVERADWEGMRHRDIGSAQAWYYPADRVIVLWECYLADWCRQENPLTDRALQVVWTGFEGLLRDRFPEAMRIVTPSWEDLYEKVDWQQFLGGQGYEPVSPQAFGKALGSASADESAEA
jgi:hypothetical protein